MELALKREETMSHKQSKSVNFTVYQKSGATEKEKSEK